MTVIMREMTPINRMSSSKVLHSRLLQTLTQSRAGSRRVGQPAHLALIGISQGSSSLLHQRQAPGMQLMPMSPAARSLTWTTWPPAPSSWSLGQMCSVRGSQAGEQTLSEIPCDVVWRSTSQTLIDSLVLEATFAHPLPTTCKTNRASICAAHKRRVCLTSLIQPDPFPWLQGSPGRFRCAGSSEDAGH